MKTTNDVTKMWSYRLVWDTMFAPNPFFDMLTLATCKPNIRRSPNTKEGMWIAGWSACTLHCSPLAENKTLRFNKGEEQLIFLAQIDEILTLDDYWKKYPQKRCKTDVSTDDVRWYGDNIYHKDDDGVLIQEKNNNGHGEEDRQRDYFKGKNALICNRFYYFAPDKRFIVPEQFQKLVHGSITQSQQSGRGESIKYGELVDRLIEYVTARAQEQGVANGIVGNIPVTYTTPRDEESIMKPLQSQSIGCGGKKKGCGK